MNQLLTDEEIREISIDCASVSPSDIYFARVIEAKILKALNSADPIPVIDLKYTAYDALCDAAMKSTWMPEEYTANDWLYDCVQYLIDGHPTVPSALNSADPVAWQERQQTKTGFTNWYDSGKPPSRDRKLSEVIGGIEYQWRPLFTHPPAPSAVDREIKLTEERDALKAALEKLSCLGNGDSYGNSIGNCIAQEALKGERSGE